MAVIEMDRGVAILLVGALLLTAGLVMPDTLMEQKEVCTDPAPGGGCWESGLHEVTVEKKNDYKVPAMFGGFSLAVVGIALRGRL